MFETFKKGREDHERIRDDIIEFLVEFHENNPDHTLDHKQAFSAVHEMICHAEKINDQNKRYLLQLSLEKFSIVTWLYILTEVGRRTTKDLILADGTVKKYSKNEKEVNTQSSESVKNSSRKPYNNIARRSSKVLIILLISYLFLIFLNGGESASAVTKELSTAPTAKELSATLESVRAKNARATMAESKVNYSDTYDKCLAKAARINNGVVEHCSLFVSRMVKKEMNIVYDIIYKDISEQSKDDVIKFEESQKSWLKYRQVYCEIAGSYIGSPMYNVCPMRLNISRVRELRELAGSY
jgi:uncharacterized protein YecT (DUF1311 family)